MQRRRPKIGRRDRQSLQRPKGRIEIGGNARRNGLFGVGAGINGSARLDGGVRSQIRTGLRLKNRTSRELTGQIRELGHFCPKQDDVPRC
jgi:hypothetical protein